MRPFEEVYKEILPQLSTLEEARVAAVARAKKGKMLQLTIGGGVTLAILAFGMSDSWAIEHWLVSLGPWGILVFVFGYFYYMKQTQAYAKEVKEKVIRALIENVGYNLQYTPEDHIGLAQFKDAKLFNSRIDRYSGEDHIIGQIGKTDVEMSELKAVRVERTRGSDGKSRTRHITVFKGLFVHADFHKDFQGQTFIYPDLAESTFGWLGRAFQKMSFTPGNLIELENPEFEKAFAVYSTDEIEVRYILSLNMMERILELKKEFNCQLYMSFKDGKVNIAISSSHNFFEPDYKRSLLNQENILFFYKEAATCLGIVEDLNLNTRIWSKT